jgi:hypothetical protein
MPIVVNSPTNNGQIKAEGDKKEDVSEGSKDFELIP